MYSRPMPGCGGKQRGVRADAEPPSQKLHAPAAAPGARQDELPPLLLRLRLWPLPVDPADE